MDPDIKSRDVERGDVLCRQWSHVPQARGAVGRFELVVVVPLPPTFSGHIWTVEYVARETAILFHASLLFFFNGVQNTFAYFDRRGK